MSISMRPSRKPYRQPHPLRDGGVAIWIESGPIFISHPVGIWYLFGCEHVYGQTVRRNWHLPYVYAALAFPEVDSGKT